MSVFKRFMSTNISPEVCGYIKKLSVVGAGQMGIGIGLVAARVAKLDVEFVEPNEQQIERGFGLIDKLLEKDISRGRCTEQEMQAIKSRISTVSSVEDIKATDFVIEAVTENVDLKKKIFSRLSAHLPKDTIIATNTSSISVTKIASAVQPTMDPSKVIGMHFMNPVPVMKLVEIIPGLQTSENTLAVTVALAQKMNKVTTVSKDAPGFVANRLLMPYINEAVIALDEGIASREDIDTTMKLGMNMPMGPLTLADFIGLDTCLAIMEVLHKELGDSKYRPAVLLRNYVEAGWLGKKSGRGFYDYNSQ
ncbi:hypothetical protein H4219_002503 [Mycoemilia scoparia]|uniref:3-hydroxybutyryl-CoA dehydrogenase n=1 Tax=Mycoemilia scoparia TaxID=417184 RepID=A0A9W7ZXB3_9FUNG|nr:hypothetical protein H4219_002503 [Mycoemilia scoparia]